MKLKKLLSYFSIFEWCLWIGSVLAVTLSFVLGGDFYFLTLIASLVGVSSLIFIAKGNVVGQFLIIIFSVLYAIVSIRFRYWGEMITYVFMSLPSSIVACVSWLRHPSKAGKSEVEISPMNAKKWVYLALASLGITVLFYFLLKYFNTANLPLSTLSVATSFFAAMLLILRSPFYAIGYALNDLVLIGLWVFASIKSVSYLPMVFCFLTFLVNDCYGFINWKRMQKQQKNSQ
jgi:nicotinamide mononucleotide transporter PnuC